MLFNSYLFLFLFLPLTLLLFFISARFSKKIALSVLFCASLIFYCWNNCYFGIILMGSIVFNFLISQGISKTIILKSKRYLLLIGIISNLLLLCYFKYTNFFIQNINIITHHQLEFVNVALPIGISFFTFTQIAYLVDSYRGLIEKHNFLSFALFVTYFPHLIAGPIIHHSEMMPQFESVNTFKISSRNLLIGLNIFAIGLFKKVILADYFAKLVIPVFDISNNLLSTIDAWVGALSYTFELYFDFSGYSDMAIGLSLLFGIKLPINFNSPYKAVNIIDFWRRWNITLSRFLRNYLYIALGGNRKGSFKRYRNLIITMLLGGLWHGANWTFVLWGGLHGIYLCINHCWIALKKKLGLSTTHHFLLTLLSRLITFIAVVIAWVFFRSPDVKSAFTILHAMFNVDSLSTGFSLNVLRFFSSSKMIVFIFISFFCIWMLPNVYQIWLRYKPGFLQEYLSSTRLVWKPNLLWISCFSLLFTIGICAIQTSSIFLYFQF